MCLEFLTQPRILLCRMLSVKMQSARLTPNSCKASLLYAATTKDLFLNSPGLQLLTLVCAANTSPSLCLYLSPECKYCHLHLIVLQV